MKLSEFKKHLEGLNTIAFELPNGNLVARHFHVTEIGAVSKKFIDCGGTVREENVINFQLWEANDYDHRLHPEKLINIIELSQKTLALQDHEIEVEYQGESISKYGLAIEGSVFKLITKHTDCLAKETCGIPEKPKVALADINKNTSNTCIPGSGCC